MSESHCVAARATALAAETITGPAMAAVDAMINGTKQAATSSPLAPTWVVPKVWEREFPVVTEEEISAKARMQGNMKPIHHDCSVAQRTLVRGENLLGVVASLSHLIGYIETAVGERFEQSVVVVIEHLQMVSPLYAGALPRVTCEVEVLRRIMRVKINIRNGSETIVVGHGVLLPTEQEPMWFPTDFVDQPE